MESYLIKIKELSKPIIEEYGFILVDVKKVVEFGAVISQVIIDDPKTFTLDIDIVGEINQRILDEVNDFLPDDSYLEVTSLGIERELLSEDDYNKALDEVFSNEDFLPTMIHGDYWMPNFIIDPEKSELLSVVDPFNLMWADPEYELFALTVGYGEELGLYELYKSQVKTSRYCDVKAELYALYSEILWYKKLGDIDHSFLRMRAERLMNVMKRFELI